MAQQSSERACDRCRERRVKCDKTQPTCLRCEKLGKPCPGYDKKRKFVDEGISLRKKYQASPDRRESQGQTSDFVIDSKPPAGIASAFSDLAPSNNEDASAQAAASTTAATGVSQTGSFPNHRFGNIAQDLGTETSTQRVNSLPQAIPAQPFSVSTDPALFPEANFALQGLQQEAATEELWNDTTFDPAWFNLDPEVYYASNNNACGFIPNAHIVDEVDRSHTRPMTEADTTSMSGLDSFTVGSSMPDGFSGGNSWARESQLHTSAIITDEREHEMAYLIRHFTESIGPWMDLFDKDRHFAHLVPLKALRDALLRNAIAAVAAKQLGRVKGTKPFVGNQNQKPATMEVIENDPGLDWFYKAANYYDKAIAFSRAYLQTLSGGLNSPTTPGTQLSSTKANSDDLLVAVSIFSLYESLDNLEMGWLQHLAGLKSLLSAVSPNQQSQYQVVPAITVGRSASFWNFARADYQAAYINRQRTLLDTGDLALWRSCGLQIQDNGSLYANPLEIKGDPIHCRQIAQLVSHTLLWLVLHVVNYIAVDTMDAAPSVRKTSWEQLTMLLDSWYGNLPETFQPCAQMRYPLKMGQQRTASASPLTEVFFSIDQCAAAIQLYHFARILMLLNKPQETSASGGLGMSRLKAYREVSAEAIKHAHEIIGIALGRPHPAVRVEMLLPLYVAGGCLEADEERKVVLDVLKAIEKDTGCSTGIRVRSLVDEWGWNQEPEGVD